jgi:hypothetical protein
MINHRRRVAALFGLGVVALTLAACNSDPQNGASANGASSVNSAAGNGAAEANVAAEPEPSAEENQQQAAAEAALAEAENATGPVALASDADLPQSCQDHVRAIQACIGRVRRSGQFAEHRERMLRRMLHTSRTDTWPAWARSEFLERGCAGQTENLDAAGFREC